MFMQSTQPLLTKCVVLASKSSVAMPEKKLLKPGRGAPKPGARRAPVFRGREAPVTCHPGC